MADNLKRTKSGHLRRHPTTGHLVYGCTGCCGDNCTVCSGATPPTLTLTLAGTAIVNGCVNCFDGVDSMDGPGGNFDGTYTLSNSADEPCCWTATFTTAPVSIYQLSNDCGVTGAGAPLGVITTWTIRLCLFVEDGTYHWFFEVSGGAGGFVTQLFTAPDVIGPFLTAEAPCTSGLPSFTNGCNGACGFGTFYAGNGGTAVVSWP